jgi:hypothetical protein
MGFIPMPRVTATLALTICVSVAATAMQTAPSDGDTMVTLERTACLGTCPVYTVSIDALGNVVYEGKRHVRVTGKQTARISPARIAEILERAERLRFFDLENQYLEAEYPDGSERTVTDLPTTIVTITHAGRSKRIVDYYGAPAGLTDLERLVDEVAQTRQWVEGMKR